MASRGRALDHERVDPAVRPADQHGPQGRGRDDRRELRPREFQRLAAAECLRIEPREELLVRPGLRHVQFQLHRSAARQTVEHAGDGFGNSGPHQDPVHAGEHGAIQRRQGHQLDLFQIVDSHLAGMALFGQEHLDEVAQDEQVQQQATRFLGGQRLPAKRLVRRFAARDEVPLQDAFGRRGDRKLRQRPAHVATRVSELQTAHQDQVQPGSRYDPQLPRLGDRPGEPPSGHPDPHAALDNPW